MAHVSLDHLAALGDAQRRFLTTLASADPESPVPTCAPWRVADLALHLGGVHWWAAAMALGVDLDPHEPAEPRDTSTLVGFYAWAAAELRSTLAVLGPHAPCATLVGPGQASFWGRRQLHETLVHLWDLQVALGADVDDSPHDEAWVDTVAEVVDTMTPRQVRLGRIALPAQAVELVAPGRSWRLGPDLRAAATVHGRPRDLALLLWGRLVPGDRSLHVSGDAAAVDRLFSLRLTP
jgi:uncharacterized protein (TIGR03083 family)